MSKPLNALFGHSLAHRVAFVGPVGVGKTTALRAISDIPVVNTDVDMAQRQAFNPDKTTTTVGFDYGELQFSGGVRAGLFGLPGQTRFDAVWRSILPTANAVVLWVFGNTPRQVADLTHWLDMLSDCVPATKLSVAVTRVPEPVNDRQLDPLRAALERYNPVAPLLTADPRLAAHVRLAIAMALAAPRAALDRS